LASYEDLGHGPVTSYFRRVVDPLVPSDADTLHRLTAFTRSIGNYGKWAGHVLRYITSPKHAFLNHGTASGVYALDDQCKLAVAGDWGTGTDEEKHVTDTMKKEHDPDYTIHLGDVDYVGDWPELEENCLGRTIGGAKGVRWQLGSKGSFALKWLTCVLPSTGKDADSKTVIPSLILLSHHEYYSSFDDW
jgi:hypothetical protein